MPAETLTCVATTDRLGFAGAFRAFVNWLRVPVPDRNNGNALVAVDVAERPTVAVRSPEVDQSVVATLTARIATLEAEFARVEAAAAIHRADFERERERCERLLHYPDRPPGGTNGAPLQSRGERLDHHQA
jgi:uncharacterized small protein (DUF1192 family)